MRGRDAVGYIFSVTALLALLYFGREVLVPITLAVILSLLVAPLVRGLKRLGLGHVPAVLGAVLAPGLLLLGLTVLIATQLVATAASLPQYESTIRAKIQLVQAATLGRLDTVQLIAGRIFDPAPDRPGPGEGRLDGSAQEGSDAAPAGVVPVEIRERPPTAVQLMERVFASAWGPLGSASVVLIVLVFVLLEHESLRDRFIRLVGGADLRGTTQAFNDAGARLSRFFVSQFTVNVGVGAAAGIGLALIGLPHAVTWAALTALLRCVPYVGVWIAAFGAALLAAAVDPGWSLMFMTLALYIGIEFIAGQVIEPLLYGHSTGLSPLSVVVAAIFWSWLWGPIGLLVSTPLTLCLVVAGRHVQALGFLDILLGDTPALTMSERFYQRALSGDADEIIAAARIYLRRKSFASYCDSILLPALLLAGADLDNGSITPEQQRLVRNAVIRVIEGLGRSTGRGGRWSRWPRRASVLEVTNPGLQLRQRREKLSGKWQGPLAVTPGSVTLCVGLGSVRDDLITELLVRLLRDLDIDARHSSIEELQAPPPPGTSPTDIALVFIVSALPAEDRSAAAAVAGRIKERFPQAARIGFSPLSGSPDKPGLPGASSLRTVRAVEASDNIDAFALSFEEAVELAQARYLQRPPPAPA